MSVKEDYICPVFASSGKCGEQDALKAMQQFKNFYEQMLNEVDVGDGDSMEMKLKIQRRWIDDLTEQTQMMARIVQELEDEATTRVKLLEDKLRQTSKNAYEVMKRYQTYSISHSLDEPFQRIFYLQNDLKNIIEFVRRVRDDNKWNINGLQFYEVTYKDLFGTNNNDDRDCDDDKDENTHYLNKNGLLSEKKKETHSSEDLEENNQTYNHLIEQLNRKTKDFEELRQSMLDMRSALTEEVACKHDMISALRKDIQQLEERCVQADKQTAFKDDIIKELRKENKRLKQQNKEREGDLETRLKETKSKLQAMKPCVETASVYTCIDDDLVIKKSKLIQNKDNIIQIQNDTLNVIDVELQGSRKREKQLEEELTSKQREIIELNFKCRELETALSRSQSRAENLQNAVDLYINSINVLEASEEKARIEIEQQKMTIANLQEALVSVKQELDELRESNQQEVSVGWAARWFGSSKPNQKSVHDV